MDGFERELTEGRPDEKRRDGVVVPVRKTDALNVWDGQFAEETLGGGVGIYREQMLGLVVSTSTEVDPIVVDALEVNGLQAWSVPVR